LRPSKETVVWESPLGGACFGAFTKLNTEKDCFGREGGGTLLGVVPGASTGVVEGGGAVVPIRTVVNVGGGTVVAVGGGTDATVGGGTVVDIGGNNVVVS
jgi:hypothetical protein